MRQDKVTGGIISGPRASIAEGSAEDGYRQIAGPEGSEGTVSRSLEGKPAGGKLPPALRHGGA